MQSKIQAALSDLAIIFGLFVFGLMIGVGQLLSRGGAVTAGMLAGEAICRGALTMAAGAVLLWVPDVPIIGLFGIAGVLASLGTNGLERVLDRLMDRFLGGERP